MALLCRQCVWRSLLVTSYTTCCVWYTTRVTCTVCPQTWFSLTAQEPPNVAALMCASQECKHLCIGIPILKIDFLSSISAGVCAVGVIVCVDS